MKKLLIGFLTAVVGFAGVAFASSAEATSIALCSFTRDLQMGSFGEDVRCLQNHLVMSGFAVSASGYFDATTRTALAQWQSRYAIPATGYFGPYSRARYGAIAGYGYGIPGTPVPPVYTNLEDQARTSLLDALTRINEAEDDLDDSDASSRDQDDAQDFIDDARASLLNALRAFVARDYARAIDLADDARSDADEAIDLADVRSGRGNGDLTFAEATIFTNETVIKVEFDNDEYVFTTQSDDEDDIIDDILDEVDDNDLRYNDVEDELVIREKNRRSTSDDKDFDDFDDNDNDEDEDDAEDALDDARDMLDDAWDEYSDAVNDGRFVGDARTILEDADDALDEAEDALDDGDWDDAVDFAEEAEELAQDALDEIN